jgi:hypothetical protein
LRNIRYRDIDCHRIAVTLWIELAQRRGDVSQSRIVAKPAGSDPIAEYEP